MKTKFGTDPEAFIFMEQENGIPKIIPPAALVEDFGQKMKEIGEKKVLIKHKNFQWSEDGAAIEAQINPSTTASNFYSNVVHSMSILKNFLFNINPKLKASFSPLGYFDVNKYWTGRDESFRQCVIFGCDPDMSPDIYRELGFESWENYQNELDVSEHTFRYGGGHLHIQSPESNPELFIPLWDISSIVLDHIVGLVNTSIPRPDSIKKLELARLEYYGKPGRIRLQNYSNSCMGIEYRVMSNYWLTELISSNKIINAAELFFDIINKGLGERFVDNFYNRIGDTYSAIITLNKENADSILEEVFNWIINQDKSDFSMINKARSLVQ